MSPSQAIRERISGMPMWVLILALIGFPAGSAGIGGKIGNEASIEALNGRIDATERKLRDWIAEGAAASVSRDSAIEKAAEKTRSEFLESMSAQRLAMSEQARLLESLRSEVAVNAAKTALYQDRIAGQMPQILDAVREMSNSRRK